VTNALKALDETRITSFPVSPENLADMTADLVKIIMHLHSSHSGRAPLRGAVALEILRAPWRYRHRQQPVKLHTKAARFPQLRKRAPKRAPQPQSSGE